VIFSQFLHIAYILSNLEKPVLLDFSHTYSFTLDIKTTHST
jgi:endonuclease IV